MQTPSPNRRSAIVAALAILFLSITAARQVGAQEAIVPPLHTSGHAIVDAKNHRIRLTSVNWFGFDQKEFVAGGLDHATLSQIIEQIHALGLNSVRLPWANETIEKNPVVPDYA